MVRTETMLRKYGIVGGENGTEWLRIDIRVLCGAGNDLVQDADILVAVSAIGREEHDSDLTFIAEGRMFAGRILLIRRWGHRRHRQMRRRLPCVVAGGMKIGKPIGLLLYCRNNLLLGA